MILPAHFRITAQAERWPLAKPFVISRGAKTEAHVVVATVTDGTHTGRGECVPYARYGESVDGVLDAIRNVPPLSSREALQRLMPAGAARNALDCAIWDLEAKRSGVPAAVSAGLGPLAAVETCYTLSLDTPEGMAEAARAASHLRLLKLKLGGAGDIQRMEAVRRARPSARLVADANEAWSEAMLEPYLAAAAAQGFELIEQPLPQDHDAALARIPRPVPVCADESVHTARDVALLCDRYDAVNIKLDKAGGLTEALLLQQAAREAGLKIMVGSMVGTSLGVAPAFLIAQAAQWADLDGPLLLSRDRNDGISIAAGRMSPPPPRLWG